nr:arf-GAP with dual PH domain-containing protein 2-like isoform X1 [Pocillopora verrucosa]XP_058970799.1 arf-GAP with dual PH domain-containing protein 2-like isoform X1 [Pocillopora verrucosa]
MSSIKRQNEKAKTAIVALKQENGNDVCADCSKQDPRFTCLKKGLFLCQNCAQVHTSFGGTNSRIKSIDLGNWNDETLQFMEEHGNAKGNAVWAKNVPLCYRRPKPSDAHVLREQWIRAKYERTEFIDGAPEPSYLTGSLRGYLRKKGKEDNSWNLRLFVLSAADNSLAYYIRDQDREPKSNLKITEINVTFAEERTNKENSLQITYVTKGRTRNYFVYSENGQEVVQWYMAIRKAKLDLLGYNESDVDQEKLENELTRDFIMQGFLFKRGPRDEPWKKRWFSLDGRRLLYFEEPMDALTKGELIIGSNTEGFALQEGVKSGKHQDEDYCFTLTTPKRDFVMMANTENERRMWMDCLSKVISQPMTDEDKEEMKTTLKAMKDSKKKSFSRLRSLSMSKNQDEDSP